MKRDIMVGRSRESNWGLWNAGPLGKHYTIISLHKPQRKIKCVQKLYISSKER